MSKLWIALFLLPAIAHANRVMTYQGNAKADQTLVYTESHVVEYDDTGKLLKALTRYVAPNGKDIAELQSDFKESLTVPTHVMKDFRTGDLQGLRREGPKFILFDQERGKAEKTREIKEDDADGRILVGCQGLNYYLLSNIGNSAPSHVLSHLPLRFLIPGKLDYYDFMLEQKNVSPEGIIDFEIAIQNWFLKLFAPKLYVKYDKNRQRIIWYKGISNITTDQGGNQTVTIDYVYPQ